MGLIQFQQIQTRKMIQRPRRNRKSEAVRSMIRENEVKVSNLIQPIFLIDGQDVSEVIPSLPVAKRLSLDKVLVEIGTCTELGIHTFIMFPAIAESNKDKTATYSYDPNNFYLKAATVIKNTYPDIVLISDVAMDPYSIDGHDGYVDKGEIINDITLPILQKMALAQAEAGFDMLGPSDMMDGRVDAIRDILDEHGYYNVSIMSYTAKYSSALYGPFRDALDSAPKGGDKKTYQMDPANKMEALIEAELDDMEGADFLMVKPALHYLDVIHLLKTHFSKPIAAYHVSGECAMLCAAVQNGWLDYKKIMPETLLCLKRAGADAIITYFAKEFALMQSGKESEYFI